MTHVTVYWELSFCVLIWPRLTRPLVLALAIPLHLGIAFCMGMMTFGLVMLIGCLSFVPPWLVRRLIERRGSFADAAVEQGRAGDDDLAETLPLPGVAGASSGASRSQRAASLADSNRPHTDGVDNWDHTSQAPRTSAAVELSSRSSLYWVSAAFWTPSLARPNQRRSLPGVRFRRGRGRHRRRGRNHPRAAGRAEVPLSARSSSWPRRARPARSSRSPAASTRSRS